MAAMREFNDELRKTGALLSVDGLKPLTTGARLAFSANRARVMDGSLIKSTEVVGGYWMLEPASKQQVVEWMKRCPAQEGDVIEIRPIAEMSDFPPEVRAAARGT